MRSEHEAAAKQLISEAAIALDTARLVASVHPVTPRRIAAEQPDLPPNERPFPASSRVTEKVRAMLLANLLTEG